MNKQIERASWNENMEVYTASDYFLEYIFIGIVTLALVTLTVEHTGMADALLAWVGM